MPELEKSDFSKFYKTNDLDLSWMENPEDIRLGGGLSTIIG